MNKATKRALRENSKGTDGRSSAAQVSHQPAGGTVESATEKNKSLKKQKAPLPRRRCLLSYGRRKKRSHP
ncbi:hypothetical protein [Xanthomonas vesicatoria]|uniref:Uncharacterized protein n=1 Tax=Xanthomonas vesicatoria TaxID=56460 RepID=A0ABS8L8A2_9XANT|nr:hypothetical protein [Xanthomonas vesicatoria]MCC8621960.1 hypothetical protein [Xanthomonas vesicatoria]MCC8695736.1 hypothetical protein [Xanthomonas vesicatoria]MCC8704331.1 hypothetical protein [Xanthomonas vesicatoria]MDG4488240.1 hypothetical protein [Xanthomonas vesicatoria]